MSKKTNLFVKSAIFSALIVGVFYSYSDFVKKKNEKENQIYKSIKIDQETLRQVSVGIILNNFVTGEEIKNTNNDEVFNTIIKNEGLAIKPSTILGDIEFLGNPIDHVGYKTNEKYCKMIQNGPNKVNEYISLEEASKNEYLGQDLENKMFCYKQKGMEEYSVAYRVEGTSLGK